MAELNFDTGVKEVTVNGVRTVSFNPSDVGFLELIYGLLGKIDAIQKDYDKKKEGKDDPAKLFDYSRQCDKKMREAVDAVFGAGFCDDVFKVRLVAITSTGLTAIENFLFAVIDEMDDTVAASMEKRKDSISKYTAKYEKYHNR